MRLFVSGSAPLLAATHAAFEARTGQRILERYGMTETGMNASNPLAGERRAGTVGPALPGVELRVCAPDGAALAAGEVGVLEVRGPNVFSGYWRMPEKTAEEMRPDGWFVTGDLARIGADGYVTIVGRAKDLIISGGLNVYPKEVEAGARRAAGGGRERGDRRAASGLRRGGGGGADRARRSGRRGGGAARAGSRRSSCRSTWRWSRSCRATPWARCRRACCASVSPGCSAVDPDRPTERRWPRTPTYLAATRCGWRRVGWRRESCRRHPADHLSAGRPRRTMGGRW